VDVDVVRQRQMTILHPYMVEVYVTRDGSETRLSLDPPKAHCAQNGAVREVRIELAFSRYETYEEQDERGVQTQAAIDIHHNGEGVREGALTIFPLFCIGRPPRCGWGFRP